MTDRRVCEQILDLARWAPSGDNTQPWRFEIVADDHIAIHGHDTRDHVLYDFDGHPSHMAHGALLETLRIAATGFGLTAVWALRRGTPDTRPIYDVTLKPEAGRAPDLLIPFIKTRTVQRRPMRTTPLTVAHRDALRAATGPDYEVRLYESFAERRGIAGLLWDNAHIRLTCPEAYPVHREIIEWNARFSRDRIPEQAVGVDPLTAKLMRWVMQSWKRVDFFNRYLLGTVPPRIQLDFLPAILCAAHVLIRAKTPPVSLEDYVRAGVAMQRLWLTAAAVGLHLQPEMTPVIFRWYARAGRTFSSSPRMAGAASALATRFERLAGAGPDAAFVFFCRVGRCQPPSSRSVRRELRELMARRG
jgi:nitroreductase